MVNAFVRAGLLYESCEKFKDREYHNAVFVGKDENGVPRHAHKRSLNSLGKTFRINVEGSDPRCSFHYTGTSNRLYVFEAPIDLMSFLSHLPAGRGQCKFLPGLLLLLWGGGIDGSLLPAQQTGDGLGVGEVIELLDEGKVLSFYLSILDGGSHSEILPLRPVRNRHQRRGDLP